MPITKRMDVVRICDALSIDYDTYMRQPKWWIALRVRKIMADNEFAEKKTV